MCSSINDFLSGENGDPRVKNYFLLTSPFPVTIILATYFSFVLKIGPALMKNVEPFKIDRLVMVYNIFQIISNAVLFILGLNEVKRKSIFCSLPDTSYSAEDIKMMNLHYCYYLLKVIDLLDTVIFVLRKKNNQITFLHVYHHSTMVIAGYFTTKYIAGGQLFYMGLANVFVHVAMYFYYFLTSWDSDYKKSVWWKKYLTQLQILQHCFVAMVFGIPLLNKDCTYSKPVLLLCTIQAFLMVYLFTKFYIRTYIKKEKVLSKNR